MTKEIWVNLPVSDVRKTKEFYGRIGFKANERQSNEQMACFTIGKKQTTVLFFEAENFKKLTKSEIADARAGAEVLISFDAGSRDEVDETARRVFDAGGTIFSAPAEIQGWMYGFGFADADGHRWNMVFMDSGKMPQ
jgi:hypothetical protein